MQNGIHSHSPSPFILPLHFLRISQFPLSMSMSMSMDNQKYGDAIYEKHSDTNSDKRLENQAHLDRKLENAKRSKFERTKAHGDGDLDKKEKDGHADFGKDLKKCTVLGGRGVIGRALVDRLLSVGKWMVRVADYDSSPLKLQPCEKLLSDAISTGRAAYFQVDVRQKSQIIQAVQGVSVVFYIDSVKSPPQDFYLCYRTIVQGAKNVVNACRECKIKRLIYNSCADVVFDDVYDIHDGNESLPYSGQFWNTVSDLRTQAEALILFANGIGGLSTCALRPCNVFGPGDEQFFPPLFNIAKSKWAKFIIGSRNKISDFTYVDNIAHAHVCAEESLNSMTASASRKVFFVTNMNPMNFWDFVSLLLESLGFRRPVVSIPLWSVRYCIALMKLLSAKLETTELGRLCSCVGNVASLASCTRTFNCSKAQRDIQYSPIVSAEDAMKLTVDSLSNLAIDSPFMKHTDPSELSKVEKFLGNGKVSDILMWRDEVQTVHCFFVLAFLYAWFFLWRKTLITSVASLLSVIVLLLCGHHILPLTDCGSEVPQLPSSCFEISEIYMRSMFSAVNSVLSKADSFAKSFARGEDWPAFFKVSIFLYFCKVIVPHYVVVATGSALILSFTMCVVYKQYEEKFDKVAIIVFSIVKTIAVIVVRKLTMSSTLRLESLKRIASDRKI